ncbi:hypothetical protein EBO15_16390 [Actinomadura harenae]|uniref:Uncharacterized protein n=1 Tax=Actinomadura harenae TaxID=2483351 RepID=A0A3M2M3X7_9ACTN|nr:hypothetical protein EBO15_16390 [Actinomadura harenae]
MAGLSPGDRTGRPGGIAGPGRRPEGGGFGTFAEGPGGRPRGCRGGRGWTARGRARRGVPVRGGRRFGWRILLRVGSVGCGFGG